MPPEYGGRAVIGKHDTTGVSRAASGATLSPADTWRLCLELLNQRPLIPTGRTPQHERCLSPPTGTEGLALHRRAALAARRGPRLRRLRTHPRPPARPRRPRANRGPDRRRRGRPDHGHRAPGRLRLHLPRGPGARRRTHLRAARGPARCPGRALTRPRPQPTPAHAGPQAHQQCDRRTHPPSPALRTSTVATAC